MKRLSVILFLALSAGAVSAFDDFDPSLYEEEAGLLFNVQVNPGDEVYGIEFSDGTWLVNTPIFGALVLNGFVNEGYDATQGGIGMIFRLMPHSDIAPFVGAGLTWNALFRDDDAEAGDGEAESEDDDDAFWGGHAEAGVRVWFAGREQFIEVFARQTWNLDIEDSDYWVGGFGFGQNF